MRTENLLKSSGFLFSSFDTGFSFIHVNDFLKQVKLDTQVPGNTI